MAGGPWGTGKLGSAEGGAQEIAEETLLLLVLVEHPAPIAAKRQTDSPDTSKRERC